MVLDTLNGEARLLISCTGRRDVHTPYGEILSMDLVENKPVEMSRYGEPDSLLFRPHGIYLDGDKLLVISHEREPDLHPVLIYKIRGNSLHFQELIQSSLIHSPNALVTGPMGEIYVVNDSGKRGSLAEKILRLKRASIVRLQKTESDWEVKLMAEGLGYPAGINRIGNRLYVGDAILHRIHVFRIKNGELSPDGEITGLRGNDNIRIHQNRLIVPGHIKPFRFIRHAKDPVKFSPVVVFRVDPSTGSVEEIYGTDGTELSGGSSAIIYNNRLYICQVFDPFLLRVDLSGP